MNTLIIKLFSAIKNDKIAALLIAVLSAYLMLINLDYVALWHDEGTNAMMARSFINQGNFSGWDGRNLFFGADTGTGINNELNIVTYPPWPALPSALGIWLFGDGEFGLRFFHALLGVLSLPIFYLLLRLYFPASSRLRLIAFALFALSPIFILYARQGRYYADAIFFTLLLVYCYHRYRQSNSWGWWCALPIIATLNFLNHFAIGFTVVAALALMHIGCYYKSTSIRQWILFGAAGALTAALCGGYMVGVGIIGGDSYLEYTSDIYKTPWIERHWILLYYYLRDIVQFGWLPLGIVLCGVAFVIWHGWRHYVGDGKKNKKVNKRKKSLTSSHLLSSADNYSMMRWLILTVLMIIVSALISVQPVYNQQIADMRYMVMTLPFIALAIAAVVENIWRLENIAGAVMLSVLMLTNFASGPYIIQGLLCEKKQRFIFPKLVGEIHRPYPSAVSEAVAYLSKHVRQDDAIFVSPWQDYVLLLYYLGDKLIFCCGLGSDTHLPEDKIRALGAPVFQGDVKPQWQIKFANGKIPSTVNYEKVFVGKTVGYPVHRPELEYRCFTPPQSNGVEIYRRISDK